jgi:ketosteroid isomerase-like protein
MINSAPSFHRFLMWLLLAVSAIGCGTSVSDQMQEQDLKDIQETLLTLENEMNLAVDRNDCEAGLSHLGEREPIFVMMPQVVRTSDELRERCGRRKSMFASASFSIDTITVNALSRDVAYVVREGNYTLNFKDGQSPTRFGAMTTIWNRVEGEWKMVHLHESWDEPWPTPTSFAR